MKIAISCSEASAHAAVDTRFGRAKYFAVYDTETQNYEFIENSQSLNSAQGAGIQSAQHIVNAGVTALVTGHCGPKAFKVLSTAKIIVYTASAITLEKAVEQFQNNELAQIDSADVDGHWV